MSVVLRISSTAVVHLFLVFASRIGFFGLDISFQQVDNDRLSGCQLQQLGHWTDCRLYHHVIEILIPTQSVEHNTVTLEACTSHWLVSKSIVCSSRVLLILSKSVTFRESNKKCNVQLNGSAFCILLYANPHHRAQLPRCLFSEHSSGQ
jgi:hypothetical protein